MATQSWELGMVPINCYGNTDLEACLATAKFGVQSVPYMENIICFDPGWTSKPN